MRPLRCKSLKERQALELIGKELPDECGDLNLAGQRGSIYEYGNGLLVATVLNAPNSYHWSKYQEKAKALGCRITQNGDTEGSFLFDPTNDNQSKLAIEAVQAYRRRIVTEEQRLNLAKHGARTRFSSVKTPRKREGGK